eukprot:292376-Rhodomonas_salina.1
MLCLDDIPSSLINHRNGGICGDVWCVLAGTWTAPAVSRLTPLLCRVVSQWQTGVRLSVRVLPCRRETRRSQNAVLSASTPHRDQADTGIAVVPAPPERRKRRERKWQRQRLLGAACDLACRSVLPVQPLDVIHADLVPPVLAHV